jgi:D-alanyl-D-alanine carboxypeptidase (penicillin-binding protein 5/6)
VAIAEYISGDCDKFADLMNRTAWEMGAGDTSFCNPNGLPHDYHFTTAADLALITKNAMELPEFRTIVATKSRTVWPAWPKDKPLDLYNHNKLLSEYEGAIGVKTGYTDAAGRCLVSAAERNGMTFIAVTLNDRDDWNTHKQLLDSAFEAHHPQKAIKKGETLKKMIVDGKTYSFSAADDFIVPVKDNEKKHINAELHIASNLKGAVNKGEKVGYVQLKCDGKNIGSVDIVSDSEIQEINNYRLKGSFYEAWRNIWDFFLV